MCYRFTCLSFSTRNLASGTHDCDQMAKCQNIEGHWKCDCLVGYEGEGYNGTCRDIDECLEEDTCEENSVCINTPGGNICDCNQGIELDFYS